MENLYKPMHMTLKIFWEAIVKDMRIISKAMEMFYQFLLINFRVMIDKFIQTQYNISNN